MREYIIYSDQMNNHLSIQNAIDSIDYSGYLENMSSIAVIGGNADNQIWG